MDAAFADPAIRARVIPCLGYRTAVDLILVCVGTPMGENGGAISGSSRAPWRRPGAGPIGRPAGHSQHLACRIQRSDRSLAGGDQTESSATGVLAQGRALEDSCPSRVVIEPSPRLIRRTRVVKAVLGAGVVPCSL